MSNKEYLIFRELEFKGKTKKYAIVSKNNQEDILGEVKWDSGWRQYICWADGCTKWSSGCLKQIQDFIDKLKENRNRKPTLNYKW